MSYAQIHKNWDREPEYVTEGFSLEITAKDIKSLIANAHKLPPHTPIAITYLAGESTESRIEAARVVRELGFEPMPHFSARRMASAEEFTDALRRFVEQANIKRCFAIAGDNNDIKGPFSDTYELINTGLFEQYGIQAIGIAGHPDGHPNMNDQECLQVLKNKYSAIQQRNMKPLIVTQFGFDADVFLNWLKQIRAENIDAPVRIGVPGPTTVAALLKFAARCGVGASKSVLSKYGISMTKLIGNTGPDAFVNALSNGLNTEHGRVRLHFYPFGGLEKTIDWVNDYTQKYCQTK